MPIGSLGPTGLTGSKAGTVESFDVEEPRSWNRKFPVPRHRPCSVREMVTMVLTKVERCSWEAFEVLGMASRNPDFRFFCEGGPEDSLGVCRFDMIHGT